MTSNKEKSKVWGICPSCGPSEVIPMLKDVCLMAQGGVVTGIAVMGCRHCHQVVNVPEASLECIRERYARLTTPNMLPVPVTPES